MEKTILIDGKQVTFKSTAATPLRYKRQFGKDFFADIIKLSALDGLNSKKIDMKKIDWMRKLTSRKLWLSVASFVTLMVVACGGTENEAAQISALIMAGATVIGYVIGEGMTDAAAIEAKQAEQEG